MLLNRFNEFGNAFNKSEHVAINDGQSAAASNEDNDWQETGVRGIWLNRSTRVNQSPVSG